MDPATLMLIMAGASMLSGYLGSKNKQQQTSRSTTSASFDPRFSPLITPLVASAQDRMRSAGLPPGYGAQGIDTINRAFSGTQQALQNRLTSQGLGGTPIAGSGMATLEAGRGGQIAQFQTQLPLLQQQMQDQANQQAMALLGIGRGQTTDSVTTGGGTNPLAGAAGQSVGDMSQMLAYLYGQGYFNRAPQTQTQTTAPYYLAAPGSVPPPWASPW